MLDIRTFGALLTTVLIFSPVASADLLKGGVQEETEIQTRIPRKRDAEPAVDEQRPITRIPRHRDIDLLDAVIARTDGVQPELQTRQPNLAPEDFVRSPAKFDLESERGSKELMLAWELWHKQFSAAVYKRFGKSLFMSSATGSCTFEVIVSRGHKVDARLLNSTGSPAITAAAAEGLTSLDGNLGLTFPELSERDSVKFAGTWLRAQNITPGYDWDKNDFEHLEKSY